MSFWGLRPLDPQCQDGISNENSINWQNLWNYVNFTLRNRFSVAFKTLKPMSFHGLRPLDPQCQDGISDENSTKWQFIAKVHVYFTPILLSKMCFLGLLKWYELPGAEPLDPLLPEGCGIFDIDLLWNVAMVKIENSLQNNMWILPPILPS